MTAGDELEVDVEVENEARSTSPAHPEYPEDQQEIELELGGDPVDSETVELEREESTTITVGTELDPDATGDLEVIVRSSVDEDSATVAIDEGEDDEFEVDFIDCTRAEVTGSFEDGDPIGADTIFYTDTGVGTTRASDFLEIGDHVEAPFTDRIVFEGGEEPRRSACYVQVLTDRQ